MRRVFFLAVVINFLLICLPGQSYAYHADPKIELNWDYLGPIKSKRDLDTVSLHILKKISETNDRSVYRGITITRPQGDVTLKSYGQPEDSSAVGIGPVYLLRHEKYISGKLSAALDVSGGFILYNKRFPAGGEYYNFMWRIGPQLIYKFNENSSLNVGYIGMHVSNGLSGHNPGYDARGVSIGFTANF
ncbi:acyloxyacyl hydrolase [Sporomusa sphaeroides DSM 2875]|uniref:acyloxyacyl hydrolase n=1 Tax=Sporomusa sphaeroides TaxID=47679 RepID=UPI00202EF3CB|nr:acyloxyacyl hydrolase [Sporomusa sphaeroides]MCM0758013.1 acyloxyacyl hydrolase [Sporomusa sphaeroides DSM 2875]